MTLKSDQSWSKSISNRSIYILNKLNVYPDSDVPWSILLDLMFESCMQGKYLTFLAITGRYPSKFEFREFNSSIIAVGKKTAFENLIRSQLKNTELAKIMIASHLVSPHSQKVVDITHTSTAPYLTGIQRVVSQVIKTTPGAKIVTFRFIGELGLLQECNLNNSENREFMFASEETWRIRSLKGMHKALPALEKNKLGIFLKSLLLPSARKMKRQLILNEAKAQISKLTQSNFENIFLLNTEITLLEIPSRLEHISVYECMLENNISNMQIVIYDFIPFFHAWTVHPGNRGHYASYIRLALLSDKIVAISELVKEQAELIIKAFSLEQTKFLQKEKQIKALNLPSGLEPAELNEFSKIDNLVVMLGSLEPRKNHIQFFDALEILARQNIRVKALILGSAGWENSHLLDKLMELQVKGVDIERITAISDDEIREIIGSAVILIQISEAEGFGLPVMEAISLNTKVIVSDIRPLSDLQNQYPEFISKVKLNDPQELANMITFELANQKPINSSLALQPTWLEWSEMLF